ncbi:MAG: hypothetical protein K2W95_07850 [Candidatus Obscuribacterales bacterium]|nr:hypothetical protein [Candidatus Obscuribacterales bacterium]
MNEFDAYEMDEQCDEDDADLGSALHDEVYSKGLATLAALATAQSTAYKAHIDGQGNIIALQAPIQNAVSIRYARHSRNCAKE